MFRYQRAAKSKGAVISVRVVDDTIRNARKSKACLVQRGSDRICIRSPTRFDTFSSANKKYQRDNTRIITEQRSGRAQIYRTLFADIVCKLLHHVSPAVIYALCQCIFDDSPSGWHAFRKRRHYGQSETSAHALTRVSSELLRDEISSCTWSIGERDEGMIDDCSTKLYEILQVSNIVVVKLLIFIKLALFLFVD